MESNKKEFENLGATVRMWRKKWYWFVISAFLCVCLGFLYTLRTSPKYKVQASVVISEGDKSGMSALMGDLSDVFGSGGIVDDEVFKISAHSVYVQVAKDMNLQTVYYKRGLLRSTRMFDDNPLVLKASPLMADTISTGITFKVNISKKGEITVRAKAKRKTIADVEANRFPVTIKTIYGNFTLDKNENFEPGKKLKMTIFFQSYNAAAEAISEEVKTFIATKKANVIQMTTKTTCVPYSIALLDKIISVYNRKGILERNREGSQTLEFIDSRLKYIEKDLVESELSVEGFKKSRNITDVGAETSIQLKKRVEDEKNLNVSKLELELLDMTIEFLGNPSNSTELIPTSFSSPAVNEGIKNYNGLILERMKIARNAKDGNIALEMLDSQLKSIRDNILVTMKKSRENYVVTIREIESQLDKAYGKLGSVPTQEREYRELVRQKTVWENLYTLLLKNREETAMMIANATPRGIIIDEAFAYQKPVSLSRGAILIIFFILGLVIPAIYFMVRPIFRNKFENKKELQDRTSVPILGEISMDQSDNKIVVSKGSSSVINELFTNLRTNLSFILGRKEHQVILITSTNSGEGKSFVSINLAASMALLGKKVVLLGMDIRKPRLAEYIGITSSRGITDFLVDDSIKTDDIIIRNSRIPVDIITAGPVPPNPAELLNSERVGVLIEDLRKEYDFIIIDSAPIGAVSDTLSLINYANVIVYITRANYTTFDDISFFNEVVKEKNIRNVGIVINGTKARAGYGYGYGESVKKKKWYSIR